MGFGSKERDFWCFVPLLLLAPFSRCNSLLPNPTETLATQAILTGTARALCMTCSPGSKFQAVISVPHCFDMPLSLPILPGDQKHPGSAVIPLKAEDSTLYWTTNREN